MMTPYTCTLHTHTHTPNVNCICFPILILHFSKRKKKQELGKRGTVHADVDSRLGLRMGRLGPSEDPTRWVHPRVRLGRRLSHRLGLRLSHSLWRTDFSK